MQCFLAIFLKIFVFKFSGQFFFKSYERFGNLISFSSSLSSSLPRPTALRSSTVAQPLGHRLGSRGADRAEASPADCEKPSMDSVMMSLSPVLESPPAALEEAPMRAIKMYSTAPRKHRHGEVHETGWDVVMEDGKRDRSSRQRQRVGALFGGLMCCGRHPHPPEARFLVLLFIMGEILKSIPRTGGLSIEKTYKGHSLEPPTLVYYG